ncbi:hypothetical protein ACFX15_026906 [Malus domestica]|uniref:Uncharacterized protein n=1 Tax=Malus domestica TaxID=3750 RepID=A0A498KIU8_MALDO|nr:hypothetical protein DVH24_026237 [Malus domestica]
MAVLVELTDRDSLVKSASTSLNNKVVSQYSTLLAPMAVDAVLSAAIGIYVHNVAALRCATEYLEMTEKYCDNNLTGRIKDFLSQVALMSLSGAIVVLKFCEDLLPMVEDLKIVQKYVDENQEENFYRGYLSSTSENIHEEGCHVLDWKNIKGKKIKQKQK